MSACCLFAIGFSSAGGLVVGILLLWIACLSLCLVIAPVLVLSAHALTYEGLILVPIVLLSGIFGYHPAGLRTLGHALPTSFAVEFLAQPSW
ncbi:hypothetical protein CHEID_10035 [Corynebacterium heidelbergense]|nr:hypothetical protein CHEID_10035 [Corynebacterium heidelbergense]